MDRAIRAFNESRFVDYYYGPPEWKAAVEREAETPALDLVRAAASLLDALPAQGFEQHRATYLSKQVIALETVCRRLNGETFALEDEVQRCFDIRPTWTPETRFEEAHALYDEVLPGKGSLFERLRAFRNRYILPGEKAALTVDFMRRAMNEARRRVQAFLDLPQGEEVELDVVLSDGQPDAEVKQYLMRYALLPEEYARKDLEFLQDPFREGYIFTYFYGKRLMKPRLQGENRREVFKRFLTEQICPSDLMKQPG